MRTNSSLEISFYQRLIPLSGIVFILALAWLMSNNRRRIPWRVIGWGLALQFIFGVFVLKTWVGVTFFGMLNEMFNHLMEFTHHGSRFLFGDYLDDKFTFALNVLPTIIFFSSFMTVLYHLGVMQRVVQAVAWVMQKTMRTSGAETLSTAANIFLGPTEAPLMVKPFIATLTYSELMAVMVGGFATSSGGVLAAYAGMLNDTFPNIAGHLIAASVLNAPATLVLAKIVIPETEQSQTRNGATIVTERPDANVIDALTRGASEGLLLALNVAAMLIAVIATVSLINYLFSLPALWHNKEVWKDLVLYLKHHGHAVPTVCASPEVTELPSCIVRAVHTYHLSAEQWVAWVPWTLQRMLSWVCWPLAFMIGTPLEDCDFMALLLGEKTVLNEFVAYAHLGEHIKTAPFSPRATLIASYVLCGFANFGTIAIQIGGIGGMAPERRNDLARLGLRAMIAGALASCLSAAVAGVLL